MIDRPHAYSPLISTNDDATLKQFEILWAEIARRSNAQQALVAATVTVTGTVSGLVITEKADSVLLVVLAIVAPVFGLLWLDHARNIGEIGEFIRENWRWAPSWEQRNADRKNSDAGRFRFFIFISAVTIVFVCPALVGLWASAGHVNGVLHFMAAWGGAAALTALFLVSWAIQVVQSRSPSSGQSVT